MSTVSVHDESGRLLLRPWPLGRSTLVTQVVVGRGDELEHRTVIVRVVERPGKGQRAVRVAERSEEHTSELQSRLHLVCRLLLEKKKTDNLTRQHRIRTFV